MMRKEYDLGAGKPNPYAKRIGAAGRSILLERFLRTEGYVRLDDDVAEAFSNEAAVNEALRLVLRAKALATRAAPASARRRRRKSA
jgi:hypothetical protein